MPIFKKFCKHVIEVHVKNNQVVFFKARSDSLSTCRHSLNTSPFFNIYVVDWEKGIVIKYRDNKGQSLTIFIILCKLHYEYHYLLFHLTDAH